MPSSCKRQRTQSPNDSAAMLTVSVDSYPGLKAPLVSCSVLPARSGFLGLESLLELGWLEAAPAWQLGTWLIAESEFLLKSAIVLHT